MSPFIFSCQPCFHCWTETAGRAPAHSELFGSSHLQLFCFSLRGPNSSPAIRFRYDRGPGLCSISSASFQFFLLTSGSQVERIFGMVLKVNQMGGLDAKVGGGSSTTLLGFYPSGACSVCLGCSAAPYGTLFSSLFLAASRQPTKVLVPVSGFFCPGQRTSLGPAANGHEAYDAKIDILASLNLGWVCLKLQEFHRFGFLIRR